MSKFDFGKTRKIRSISLDSDVISDLLALKILHSASIGQKDLERFEDSFKIISLISAVNVKAIGIGWIKKELSYRSFLSQLYDRIFDTTTQTTIEMKRLAKAYLSEISIKPADALILASVSVSRTDCFLSWDKEHMVKAETLRIIKKINQKRNIPNPLIITPTWFLERIALSQDRTIAFYHDPIPQIIRLQFYPSKQFL